MIANYFLIAWRQLTRFKSYAAINIVGLAIGLTVYLLGSIIVDYERSHDLFWEHGERIYIAGTVFGPTANIGVGETDSMYTAFAPFIRTELEEVEAVARIVGREFLVSMDDTHYYQRVRFADPELTRIFDFTYLEGSRDALNDPQGVMLVRSLKEKFFGSAPALGKTLALDHDVELHVTAVIEDLPRNSHFSSAIMSDGALEMVAPLKALNQAIDYDLAGNFNNLSSGDITYMLIPSSRDQAWLQAGMDGIFERHFPDNDLEFISGLKVRPLVEVNTMIWDAVGLPVMDSVRLLALLVLVVAIVNYTNLATAQSLGRSREIGMRKTMGASRGQLVSQFLVESICVATLAMVLGLILLTVLIPLFNMAADKAVSFPFFASLPWIIATMIATGIAAGAYPAYLITRTSPIEALRDGSASGTRGGAFRTGMLIMQFAISIFMLAMVAVVYLQNKRVETSAEIYPKEQIITLSRLRIDAIQARLDTLRNEIMKIPGVNNVAYASQLPFEQSNSGFVVTPRLGDKDASFLMTQIFVDEHLFRTLDMPLLEGRHFDRSIAADTVQDDIANVIINELALNKLGYTDPRAALGQTFYDHTEDREPTQYTIIGVLPDQNFQGFHNQIKPTTFKMVPAYYSDAAIRADINDIAQTREAVEAVWAKLVDDYPIQSGYLDDEFQDTYAVYQGIARILGGFAGVAMFLSLVGLFGLAAFMAATRTREIGIRKVMGATTTQITRLLIWRFSKPVMWALLLALPLSYLAANQFLAFFADRITSTPFIVLMAGIAAVLVSWAVVAVHAGRIARASPIVALRYE